MSVAAAGVTTIAVTNISESLDEAFWGTVPIRSRRPTRSLNHAVPCEWGLSPFPEPPGRQRFAWRALAAAGEVERADSAAALRVLGPGDAAALEREPDRVGGGGRHRPDAAGV